MGRNSDAKRKLTSDDEKQYSASDADSEPKKTTKSKKLAKSTDEPSKPKTAKKPKFHAHDPDVDQLSSKAGEQPDIEVLKTAEGDKYVDLGRKRRATVRSFKGQVFVDIREFYGADGDEKPGKKGISLTFEQFGALKRSVSTIDSLFAEQGQK
ncbi:hypothetical protein PAXRUDRAFT_29602 [Paxillus rubicundulus Ve08.2h10]|uniref:Transcriptional coactivator p15 (PC4) C-terminal domain-containing protein n=1 Tax=Paxillus rubicundulus Ve08.2h10 TaxID=930991 RepID=A0A0D0ED87_9AGAM|nr:hypothetical protein PAXRUDRAFT_29602 [Paxillus rubicundulus Ve08.2h10]